MVIAKLKGGLGNQMFQYAYGRAFALRKKDTLKIDITSYKQKSTDTPREYSLSHFMIDAGISIANDNEIRVAQYPHGRLSKYQQIFSQKILRRFNVGWNPRYFSSKMLAVKHNYLDGFWQSHKFFESISPIIQNEFKLRESFQPEAQKVADLIQNSKQQNISAISIHVRRGDVARDAKTNPYYGICTPEYYTKAINCVRAKYPNLRFFVFSDDIDWVKQNIPLPRTDSETVFVSRPEITDYEELILMSQCSHNIIANSSFSWWAAWLNQNPHKTVIAPKEWITKHKNWHTDTIPPSWTRI
jgi:hypothetical protein